MNRQKPLPVYADAHGRLMVHSVFYTIQGEGPLAGTPAVFVRLAGCNRQCPTCDTEYTEGATEYNSEDLARAAVKEFPLQMPAEKSLVVLTGGEPFRQDLTRLVSALRRDGVPIQIETNGTADCSAAHGFKGLSFFPLPAPPLVVCSPKDRDLHSSFRNLGNALHLKYVLNADYVSPADGLPTKTLGMGFPPARPPAWYENPVWVVPEDPKAEVMADDQIPADQKVAAYAYKMKKNVDTCVFVAKKFGYRVSLQLHKILQVR